MIPTIKKLAKKVAAVALASTVVLTGFSAFNTADAAARAGFDPKKVGGTFTFATFADAVRLTPQTTSDNVSNTLQDFMFDGLITRDRNLEPKPELATRWVISSDQLTYTFYLRKDVKFHDGKPLTADDVVFTYQTYMNPDSINAYKEDYDILAKVEKVDNYTVKFTLKEKNVLLMYKSTFEAGILPKHQFPNGLKDYNSNTKIHRNPIGSGPFKFVEWRSAERIVLEANKDYWNGRPYLDKIIMRVLPDANVEELALQKGEIDLIESVQAKNVPIIQKDKDLKVVKSDTARYDYIGWNIDNPKFSEKAVRQALAYALNRQALVDKIMNKNATLAVSNFHPSEPFHNPKLKPYPYDVKKANELLDKAGWKLNKDGIREKNGVKLEFQIAYNQGNKIRESIAKAAQQDWKKIGVKATPRSYEWSIFLDTIDKGEMEAWILAWSLGTDPDKTGLFHSKAIPNKENDFVGNNTSRVRDKRVDEIFETFTKEPDAKKRIALYQELASIMAENQYNLFLYHPAKFTAFNKKLVGPNPSVYFFWDNLIDWYWTK